MPIVSASFTRPDDSLRYSAGDLICNAGKPVALEFTPPQVGTGDDAVWLHFRSFRLVRPKSKETRPAQIALMFLKQQQLAGRPVEWPAFTGTDNEPFPDVPVCARSYVTDTASLYPYRASLLSTAEQMALEGELPSTPIRVLLQADQSFVPLPGETFTLEFSTETHAFRND